MFTQSEVIGYFTVSEKVIEEAKNIYGAKRPPRGGKILVLNPGIAVTMMITKEITHCDFQKNRITVFKMAMN